jgi:hypothetical protein
MVLSFPKHRILVQPAHLTAISLRATAKYPQIREGGDDQGWHHELGVQCEAKSISAGLRVERELFRTISDGLTELPVAAIRYGCEP